MTDAPRLWTRRPKIIEPRREIIARPFGICGRFKLQVIAPHHGTVRRETPWTDNLLLDGGLDQFETGPNMLNTCVVGTGNTTPAEPDSQLDSLLASTTTLEAVSTSVNSSSPYEFTKTITKRFGQGDAAGNLAEVGIGTTTTTLFSRALILDGAGNPTTLTVQADEFLDVTYQVIGYPPLTDVIDNVSITGSGAHDIVLRAARAGSFWQWADGNADLMQITAATEEPTAYDGTLGSIENSPSGSSDEGSLGSDAAYSAGSFQRDHTYNWGLSEGNLAGGITAIRTQVGDAFPDLGVMFFQCSFDPAIAKGDTATLALNFRTLWGRAVSSS